MAIPLITNLPPAPSRLETEETFVPKADALLGQLPTFVEETNTSITEINNTADEIIINRDITVTARNSAVAAANYRGDWLPTSDVKTGESYSYLGKVWVAKQASVNVTPVEGAFWLSGLGTDFNYIASSGMQSGTITLEAFTTAKGAGTFLYTGNGTTQEIVTGIPSVDFTVSGNGSGFWLDRSVSQVKNDAGVVQTSGECLANISKVHIKGRNIISNNVVYDGLRGVNTEIYTDDANGDTTVTLGLTAFNVDGFTLGSRGAVNTNTATYVVHQELYTHVKWGTTSSGKFYVEAFNPITKRTMIYYIGDGTAEHEIPQSLGVSLDNYETKNLNLAVNWVIMNLGYAFNYNTNAGTIGSDHTFTTDSIILPSGGSVYNSLDSEYIIYGKAKSKTWNIVQYTGTGAGGNFVETVDSEGVARKPARVIIKSVSAVGSWAVFDNKRPVSGLNASELILLNKSDAASTNATIGMEFNVSGFTVGSSAGVVNQSGVRYIALVEFDTNSNGGDSYFDLPTDDTNLNLSNALLNYTEGKNDRGFNLSIRNIASDSIEFATAPDGFVYVYRDITGVYGFDTTEPKFDTSTGYFVGTGVARSYIAKVMVASGTPQYVDESWVVNRLHTSVLEVDKLMGNEPNSQFVKNALNASGEAPIYACRAWANYDGISNNIRDSGNIIGVTDNAAGDYTFIYADNVGVGYSLVSQTSSGAADVGDYVIRPKDENSLQENSCTVLITRSTQAENPQQSDRPLVCISVFA